MVTPLIKELGLKEGWEDCILIEKRGTVEGAT